MSQPSARKCSWFSRNPKSPEPPEYAAYTASRRLIKNEAGSVSVVFGASTLLLVYLVGGAVDLGRAYVAREKVQTAIDTAVLAAARVWQTEDDLELAKEKGLIHFLANAPAGLNTRPGTFVTDEAKNTITLSAVASSPAPFLAVLGKSEIEIAIQAQAQLSRGVSANRNLEIAMMLDITGSMAGNKLTALKQAAKDLVSIAIWDDQSQFTSRIALVPFAEAVRPGPYLDLVRGNRPSTNRFQDNNGYFQTFKITPCVSDRKGDEGLTDAAPIGNDKVGPVYTRTGNCAPSSEIVPLTNQKSLLNAQIDAFTAGGHTAGQIGTQWAWYMLSPEWNGIWPAASQAGPYGRTDTLKIAILMTDGEYNLAYDDAGVATRNSSRTASNGSPDGQARLTCEGMKAKGIKVFSIGFQLNSAKAEETLRRCATDSSYVYMAEDNEVLRMAFRDIAQRLATYHLSQ